MWVTGSDTVTARLLHQGRQRPGMGFTLVELLAAITIVGIILAVSVPASVKFYESMQYRQAVRDVITVLGSARYSAVNSGEFQDVQINPQMNRLSFNDVDKRLPKDLNLVVNSAQEVNQNGTGVIRFYPEGGSSGGSIDIQRPGADGITVSVDWLAGRITQERYDRP